MILVAFTFFHVLLSLTGLAAGFVAISSLIKAKPTDRWTDVFLWTTLATSVTGFMFPVHRFMPSHGVGILSVIDLGFAYFALYKHRLDGRWKRVFAISSVIALYFNVFVAIAQCFEHIKALKVLAPTQSEPPFLVAQLIALVVFIALGVIAERSARALSATLSM